MIIKVLQLGFSYINPSQGSPMPFKHSPVGPVDDRRSNFESQNFQSGLYVLILISLFYLSYFPGSWALRSWVVLMGIVLPLG